MPQPFLNTVLLAPAPACKTTEAIPLNGSPKSLVPIFPFAALSLFLAAPLHAQAPIQIAPNPGTSGGEAGNLGANILAHTTTGQAIGGEVATNGTTQEKGGYTGQLSDLTGLTVDAASPSLNELATVQLTAQATLDDATLLALDATDLIWSVLLGPLSGIDTAGLATASPVFEDTSATAQGDYLGFIDTVTLTVLEALADNFGSYAGDGLGDDWQITYFGAPPNTDAAPDANPDGDPYDNHFEFLTGYDPTDPADFFSLAVIDVNSGGATLQLSKIIPGTRYRIQRSGDLGNAVPWTEITNFTTPTETLNHQFGDASADPDRDFYRVDVEAE